MITKYIESWILFPGNLIVFTIVLGIILLRNRRGDRSKAVVGALLVATGAVVYLASTPAVDRLLLGSLERSVRPAGVSELSEAEAVVVLGGGVIADAPSEILLRAIDALPSDDPRCGITTVRGSLPPEAESRLLYGWRLGRRLGIPIVVTGGRGALTDPSAPTEAEVAAALLIDLGATVADIRIEDESSTTSENAKRTRQRFGYKHVALVTSAYHMRRGVRAFERAGLDVAPAPTAFRIDLHPLGLVDFLPSARSLDNFAAYLRETVGRWWYALRYGRVR